MKQTIEEREIYNELMKSAESWISPSIKLNNFDGIDVPGIRWECCNGWWTLYLNDTYIGEIDEVDYGEDRVLDLTLEQIEVCFGEER